MPQLVKITDGASSTTDLFSAILFEILPPQRRFKWDRQQVDQLWEDIRKAHTSNHDSYFLGTLLLVPTNPRKLSVIDGQQRLTTVSLLLAVLRDQCMNFPGTEGLERRAHGIQRLITRVDNDGHPTGDMVITLQDADNSIYAKLTEKLNSTSNSIPGKSRLARAVRLLRERVEQHINVLDRQECLRRLCEYVQSNIRFLLIEVQSEGDAYLVFDTTNTRGLRLSQAEALKARLASIAREDKNLSADLIQKWNAVARTLEERIEFADPGTEAIDAMDDYLHAVWCAREGYTTKHTMARQIAETLTQRGLIEDFFEDLIKYQESYLAVTAPSGKSWLNEDLKDLQHLNKQSFSFLTMVHKHSPNRFPEAVSLTLSLQIRNITVGSQRPNEFEKDWPRWAGFVREGQTDQAFEEIRSRMVPDGEFERSFAERAVVKPSTARHLLRRLDHTSRPNSGVQPMDVDVEHILPKSVVAKLAGDKRLTRRVRKWIEELGYAIPEIPEQKQALGKEIERSLNMLGNQALLNLTYNRRVKDLPFADKSELYGRQALELTKALVEYEGWGPSQIQERQKEMAKRAVQTWPK